MCILVMGFLMCSNSIYAQSDGIEWLGAQLRYSQKPAGSDLYADGVTLTVYLDYVTPQGTSPETQQVGVFETMTGSLVKTLNISKQSTSTQKAPACTTGGDVESSLLLYKGSISLPIMAGGYTIQWTNCCLQPLLTNAEIMPGTGVLLSTKVPDPSEMTNSSANLVFENHPSVCSGQSNQIAIKAKDDDGDELKTRIAHVQSFNGDGNLEGDRLFSSNQFVKLRSECSLKKPFGDGQVKINESGNLEINNVGPGNYLLCLETSENRKENKIGSTQWVVVVTVN